MGLILVILLVLLLVGALPSWGYSRDWGYRPSGLLGIVLIVVVVLLLTGRL
jgi:hypothetical protein